MTDNEPQRVWEGTMAGCVRPPSKVSGLIPYAVTVRFSPTAPSRVDRDWSTYACSSRSQGPIRWPWENDGNATTSHWHWMNSRVCGWTALTSIDIWQLQGGSPSHAHASSFLRPSSNRADLNLNPSHATASQHLTGRESWNPHDWTAYSLQNVEPAVLRRLSTARQLLPNPTSASVLGLEPHSPRNHHSPRRTAAIKTNTSNVRPRRCNTNKDHRPCNINKLHLQENTAVVEEAVASRRV